MNTFLPEQDSTFHSLYDWQQPAADSPPFSQLSPAGSFVRPAFESEFTGQFSSDFNSMQRPAFQMMPQAGHQHRSDSPHSAPASGGTSPWGAVSLPSQEVMYHPDVDMSKFNRGSRGSMNSLSLNSMRTSHPIYSNGHAYTSRIGMRPHALSVSAGGPSEEQPWNLIPDRMPFAQDGSAGSGAIPGMAGASFFLRSPTPTKRQRTNQACEKCRERKAKCNGGRPTCQRCAARGHICEYAKERRMRGPNKTGRRGSQADIDDPIDSPAGGVASLEPDGSETANQRDDSPGSSRPGSRRSSSEAGPSSAVKSTSGSPEPQLRASGSSIPIALPTLSNGNLNLLPYPIGPSAGPDHQRAMPSESVIRYAQSMPQIGYRYGQPHDSFMREEAPTGAWNPVDTQTTMASSLSVPDAHTRGDESTSEFPQTLHYSLSDVSSSSTPITPDRFEYAWPPAPADVNANSPQQNTFQFGHGVNEKPQPMLPTLPEFDGESNSLAVWSESHPGSHTMMPTSEQSPL